MKYRVFHRTWWRKNVSWPEGREPCIGNARTIGHTNCELEARDMCRQWNDTHKPGELSDKAEYSSELVR